MVKEKRLIEVKTNFNGYILEHSKKLILIAAGVGAVTGAVFSAMMMRKKS
jgi:hypothetical protein